MTRQSDIPVSDTEFAALIDPLGPWAGTIRVAIAVSGGADSVSLAILTTRWARAREIATIGFIVDHGLRPESASEATRAASSLAVHGIEARVLTLSTLSRGPSLAERARDARYAALGVACREAGIVDLLVGHHAGDQAETVLMRRRAGSGPDGLAGMAGLTETDDLRLLRPLLAISPIRLRDTLRAMGIPWIEDPSNHDPRALRTRLREELGDPAGHPGLASDLLAEAAREGALRMTRDTEQARQLARAAVLRPEGFALLPPSLVPVRALSALIRTIGGAPYPPIPDSVAALVRNPRPATLGGTRLMQAGRLGPGWLLLREAAGMQAPVAAVPGALWDSRFRLRAMPATLPPGSTIAALGTEGAAARNATGLPAAVLAVMPCIRLADGTVAATQAEFTFEPALPATMRPLFLDNVPRPLTI